jgi:hypothetical protein
LRAARKQLEVLWLELGAVRDGVSKMERDARKLAKALDRAFKDMFRGRG